MALCLMAAALVAMPAAQAQPKNPVAKTTDVFTDHLRIRYAKGIAARPDGFASLAVEIEPRRGMHVYAPGADDYQVISFAIDQHPRIQPKPLQYPASEIYRFEPLNETIPVYMKPFTLTVDAVVQPSAAPITVTGRIEYQACDDKVCFAPVSVPLSWTITAARR